ncbi:MAG: acyl-CoA synthetase [Halothiobacillaceae bacterium]|nr:acyl-CoA synthetase [Halothiobacillaceae bacterium]
MATPQPLIDADWHQILLYRPQGSVTVGQFLSEAMSLADRLTEQSAQRPGLHSFVVNICQDQYHFMVGFVAIILAGKINILPANDTPAALSQLMAGEPQALCLHDRKAFAPPYPHMIYPASTNTPLRAPSKPNLDSAQIVARVFTSGSTGLPVAHDKSWGKLVAAVQAGAQRMGLDTHPMNLVGTVPPQHMFGFESLVLLCLISGCPLWSGRPFYPADIMAALNAVPEPRMLVTTPFHLKALLDAHLPLPKIERLLLATAPLSRALAERAEAATGAALFEIYGCTETGQIASRRTTQSKDWALLPGVHLSPAPANLGEHLFIAQGTTIKTPTVLADRIQMQPDGRFNLLGRTADQVNIAGKRSALSYLTAQLKAIPGVIDGVFFLPDAPPTQAINRLCALVVAPSLSLQEILSALRERLDAVFLPRPLIGVAQLPYTASGKLPQATLHSVLAAHLARTSPQPATWHIGVDHPAFSGHFPGYPLLPGALLLDWVIEQAAAEWQVPSTELGIEQAKFLLPVRPGALIRLILAPIAVSRAASTATHRSFSVLVDEAVVASGLLSHRSPV